MVEGTKTVLFFPLNSPGHINSCLGIADRMKKEYGYKSVFLILGPMIGNSVRDRGHELIILQEQQPYEDYEISDDDDISVPPDEELLKKSGKNKRQFLGAYKWPQVIMRHQYLFALDPISASESSAKIFETYMTGEVLQNHENCTNAIESIKPDIIIIDSYYIPPCVINLKSIPWVRLYSANPLALVKSKLPGGVRPPPMVGFKLMNKQERARLQQNEPEKWQEILHTWSNASKRLMTALMNSIRSFERFMKEQGCPPMPHGQQAHDSPHLNLYMYPEALDYDQDDDLFEYPPRWLRCDSLVRMPTSKADTDENQIWSDKLAKASNGKESIVYFSLGSIASGNLKWMKKYLNWLKDDDKRLFIVSKGANGHKYELNESNMIGDNYIPQTFLLPRSNVAVIHGGNNSITECMYYGVPMIVLPVFADQIDNAQRLEDLGLGIRLDFANGTKDELLSAIEKVSNDKELAQRMQQIGSKMRSKDNFGKISALLKELIESGHLDQSAIDKCR